MLAARRLTSRSRSVLFGQPEGLVRQTCQQWVPSPTTMVQLLESYDSEKDSSLLSLDWVCPGRKEISSGEVEGDAETEDLKPKETLFVDKKKAEMLGTRLLRPAYSSLIIQVAGLKNFAVPPSYDHVRLPEKPKLTFMEKVPTYASNLKPPKMKKRLILMRGPENIHNQLIHEQYGIVALCGGRLRAGHMEMIRMTVNRKMDASRMFAVWRVDAPWQPLTRKGQGKRMGGGKGAIDHYVTPIKAGRIIVEVGGNCEYEEVLPFLREVAEKLPFKAKVTSFERMKEEKAEEERLAAANINPYTVQYVIKNDMGGCHDWISKYDKKWFFKHV
uniref:Large ribosomal subunit protein uL16m n=1 Tax=Scapholeberis mucronata TaxID=202097 RepID=A0A4Y7NMP7_9CRUS|nr:EOG090X0DE4 [Scapholeberis mucronata]SVE93876.1 EOG090X0DE4 [Scapholeberis mucronata]